jgi:hypothetical protein
MEACASHHARDARHCILAERGSHHMVNLIAREGDRDKWIAWKRVGRRLARRSLAARLPHALLSFVR